jgi:hypothetical protein
MRLSCMFIQGSTVGYWKRMLGYDSQTSMIHMYCTMESTYLVLQGRHQLPWKDGDWGQVDIPIVCTITMERQKYVKFATISNCLGKTHIKKINGMDH